MLIMSAGTILPLRTPKEWKLAFWNSTVGFPELELTISKAKNNFKYDWLSLLLKIICNYYFINNNFICIFFRELSLYNRYIQKKPGYVKYIEFDVDQQRLDQLYEMILSFQLTE